ncbi:MAG: guanylate kinase [Chloroflexota bacterium]|nr:guanylate kinase [Chloroflexota bacterium]
MSTAEPHPLLVVVSGPSGVGKDAMLALVRKARPEVFWAITATTRAVRPGEEHGVHHLFHTREEFLQLLERGELLEHAEVYGNLYGVPKAPVREALVEGRDAIVRTDVQGAASIRTMAPDALLIFVAPPSLEELERRLRSRDTESAEETGLRVEMSRKEMRDAAWFDAVVVNETGRLEDAAREVMAVIERERQRVPPRVVRL